MLKQYLIALFILLSIQNLTAQETGNFKIEKNTVIVDENGQQISVQTLIERINKEHLELDIDKGLDGNTKRIQIKKSTQNTPDEKRSNFKIGKKAPDFKVTDINGNEIDSKKLRGKVIVLNFWFTSCMPCIGEIPSLNILRKKYQNNPNVVFVAITFNRKNKVQKFLQYHPMKYQVVPFENPTCRLFEISGYPTNIVIDKEGNYEWISLGGYQDIGNEIAIYIEKALKK